MKVIFLGFKTCYANVFRNELFYFEDITYKYFYKFVIKLGIVIFIGNIYSK